MVTLSANPSVGRPQRVSRNITQNRCWQRARGRFIYITHGDGQREKGYLGPKNVELTMNSGVIPYCSWCDPPD